MTAPVKLNTKKPYVCAGIGTASYQEIPGFGLTIEESAHWIHVVLNDLKARGVTDILVIVSDNLIGIKKRLETFIS